MIAEYLQNQISSHQVHETFYDNVRRLPPAHVLRLTRGALEVSRYWDPVPPGFAWASREEIARFDPLLEQAVRRCLSVGGDSIALSGGFDSVSVATLAAEQRRGQAPLHAVSLRFQGTVCDEGPAQVEVARALGMPQLLRTLDETLEGQSIVGAALRLSSASPSPVLSPWQSVYTGLFHSASRLGLGRLLMGTGGDDLLNVDGSYAADRLAALDLAALWRFCRACQRTSPFRASRIARGVFWDHAARPELLRLGGRVLRRVSPALLDRVRRRRHLRASPPWALPSNRDLAMLLEQRRQSAATVELARGERSYVATIRTLAQAPLLLIERDQSHAWARSVGFTFLYPYFDRDLVDLSLRIPPDELIAGGRHKAPLRRLIAARLPSVTMHAKKVDFIQALHDMLRPGRPERVAELRRTGHAGRARPRRRRPPRPLPGRLLRWAPFVLARGLAGAQHRSVAARPLRCVVHVRRSGGRRMTPPERDQVPREKGVVAWERPTLTLLGDVKDLIHASGKGSDQGESDPASPRKGRLIG